MPNSTASVSQPAQPMYQESQFPNPKPPKNNTLKIVLIIVGVLVLFLCLGCFGLILLANKTVDSAHSSFNTANTRMTETNGNLVTDTPTSLPSSLAKLNPAALLNNLCKDVNSGKPFDSYFKSTPAMDANGSKSISNGLKGCTIFITKSYVNYLSIQTQEVTGRFTYTNGSTQFANVTLVKENGDYKISLFKLTTE